MSNILSRDQTSQSYEDYNTVHIEKVDTGTLSYEDHVHDHMRIQVSDHMRRIHEPFYTLLQGLKRKNYFRKIGWRRTKLSCDGN